MFYRSAHLATLRDASLESTDPAKKTGMLGLTVTYLLQHYIAWRHLEYLLFNRAVSSHDNFFNRGQQCQGDDTSWSEKAEVKTLARCAKQFHFWPIGDCHTPG